VVSGELAKSASNVIEEFGHHLAEQPGVIAVLFYGNVLRDPAAEGLIDFYVLTQSNGAYHGKGVAALANHLLPPNVYHEALGDKRAKVAVMTLSAFSHRMRRDSWDTTLWTRFSQPARLISAKSSARDEVCDAITIGWRTAAHWADVLVTIEQVDRSSRWPTLFRNTFGVELRPEGGESRAARIVETSPDLFARIDAEIPFVDLSQIEAKRFYRRWRLRKALGKPLNILRLIKASFTFRGGREYILSKLDRHTNNELVLKAWERRHPVLASPFILCRLLRLRRRL